MIIRRLTILVGLLVTGCAFDRRCDHVCAALRSVRLDAEGYLPRDAVFKSVGISETGLSPLSNMTLGDGSTVLDCGCWFEFTERGRPAVLTAKMIDEILNNPNRPAFKKTNQLESAVLVDKRSREICRVESTARRRMLAAEENQEARDDIGDQLIQNARKVKEGDSFVEVSELVPIIKKVRPFKGEHGGTWYFIPIGNEYVLSLRFWPKIPDKEEKDGITTDLTKSLVSLPPVLRKVDEVNESETIPKK